MSVNMIRHHTLKQALAAVIIWIAQVAPSSAQLRAPDGQSAQSAMSIPFQEASAHIITLPHLIYSSVPENRRVDVTVVVTPTGTVASATPSSQSPQWNQTAAALAMSWRFVPFQRAGRAVFATFSFKVHIVPPEKRPEQHTFFSAISDWSSLRITLQRFRCRGSCSPYKLTIFGDGTASYQGDNDWIDYSAKEYRGHVSAEAVRQLVNLFRISDYFNLSDQYEARIHDAPAIMTSISFDDKSKSVLDYVGVEAGMPEVVRTVEDGIDSLAGPKVWQERQKRAAKIRKQIPISPGCQVE